MANRRTFREVFESDHTLVVVQLGPGPDGAGLVMWNGLQGFTIWLTFDGCTWERAGGYQYAADHWGDAQEWAAHRLTQVILRYSAPAGPSA